MKKLHVYLRSSPSDMDSVNLDEFVFKQKIPELSFRKSSYYQTPLKREKSRIDNIKELEEK